MTGRGRAKVAVLIEKGSQFALMREAVEALKEFGVASQVQVCPSRRSPRILKEYTASARKEGIKVFIAAAGRAPHLAGAVAVHTVLPVIAVAMDAAPAAGFGALLDTVRMPAGIPTAAVALGRAGARNAGILAAQILSLSDRALAERIRRFKKKLAGTVRKKDKKLQKTLKV